MDKFNWVKKACGLLLLLATAAVALPAQTLTTLHSFDGTDGDRPFAGLLQATNGNLYGTTYNGGSDSVCSQGLGCGTVFKITPSGTLTTLDNFDDTDGDGQGPYAGLVQGTDGNFYGTTVAGGAHSRGTIFKITDGTLTTLHSFDGTDGAGPYAGLVQATNGNLYGTTKYGGANGDGTVFKITPGGTLTTLHSFDGTDGANPQPETGLVQATDGNFYGTTDAGGANGDGTVFKITPRGTLTTLVNFEFWIGVSPSGGLVQGTDGNFYGTTIIGGRHPKAGTVFSITPRGAFTLLHSFSRETPREGLNPYAGLVQGTDGNFYGTTNSGGANNREQCNFGLGCGTIFKITPGGTLTTIYTFCLQSNCPDGKLPRARLVQDTNGTLYGATSGGGANGHGTIFRLSVGLGPFVKTQPVFASVGAAVNILGTNLTGATSVTFNGTTATFTVVSSAEIRTTVPAGATNGTVQVVTPGGTLSSNVPFRVTP